MKVRSPDWQADPRYGTADWPAPIQTPNWNGPNPVTPRTVTPPVDQPGDTLQQRLTNKQWREAIALGLLRNIPLSINPIDPE